MAQAFSSAGLALLIRLRSYGLGYATMAVFAIGVAKAVGWLELERGGALQGDQSQRNCLVRPSVAVLFTQCLRSELRKLWAKHYKATNRKEIALSVLVSQYY